MNNIKSKEILNDLSEGEKVKIISFFYNDNSINSVIIEDGVAKLPDRSAFAGSVATADRLVRTMIQVAEVPLVDAIKMMTETPAKIIGIDRDKGKISIGMDADLVLFDKNINIKMTIVNGSVVYNDL